MFSNVLLSSLAPLTIYFGTLIISLSNRCSTKTNRWHSCMFSCLIQCSQCVVTRAKELTLFTGKNDHYLSATKMQLSEAKWRCYQPKRFFNSFFWTNIRSFNILRAIFTLVSSFRKYRREKMKTTLNQYLQKNFKWVWKTFLLLTYGWRFFFRSTPKRTGRHASVLEFKCFWNAV